MGKKGLPPVHLWNPDFSGDIDIRIARNGDWFYKGSIFTRLAMVRLFSTILRKDEDDYYLVTPVEKVRIQVEDAPFVIVSLDVVNQDGRQCLIMETNTGDQLRVDEDHPLWVINDPVSGEPAPYVRVRDRLDGLISRAVFYELAELSESRKVNGKLCLGVESAGSFFVLDDTPLET
ncbi:DUF1285 domain-containing protein [Motiliproteus sp. MSK22-1]|uniref:DUF1285 domain-containing protein n=1 Tax=Motiliproteus sp. MSK22-1 TaxID=1897630 RepID=UPI000975F38F|nr:proteophosphoglycan precursor [Motiliproteus sp. MSK22-1]